MTGYLWKNQRYLRPFLRHVPDEFAPLFDHFPVISRVNESFRWPRAAVDVKETQNELSFVADIPGIKKEDIKIRVDGNVLSISGENSREDVEEKDQWVHVERRSGSFERRFQLPKNVNVEKISASSQDGVLTITVPKFDPEPEVPKKVIEVEVSGQQ